jgi:hypothetical protein
LIASLFSRTRFITPPPPELPEQPSPSSIKDNTPASPLAFSTTHFLTKESKPKPTRESQIKAMEKSVKGKEISTSRPLRRIVKPLTSVRGQQFKSEVLETLPPIQEEDSSDLAKTDSSGSSSPKSDISGVATNARAENTLTTQQKTLNNMSTSDAGTITSANASTVTGQEQNDTSNAGVNTNNYVPICGHLIRLTSLEKEQALLFAKIKATLALLRRELVPT